MIGITMRMERKDYPDGNYETRDALACDWPRFMARVFPEKPYVLLPNIGKRIIGYASLVGVDAVILSGGDDWGMFPQRDETETELFLWAKASRIPIFGVCRGAQVINILQGGKLEHCDGHVASRHTIVLQHRIAGMNVAKVNSFHSNRIAENDLAPGFRAFAFDECGGVEGFMDEAGRICGIMWHPEREAEPFELDIALLRQCLGGN